MKLPLENTKQIEKLALMKQRQTHMETSDLKPKMKDAVLSKYAVRSIPEKRRSNEQKETLEEAEAAIGDHALELIEKANQYELSQIMYALVGEEDEVAAAFSDVHDLRPPRYPDPASVETINEALKQLYHKISNVGTFLAFAEPQLTLWEEYEKRMRKRVKAIIGTDNAWEADSAFEIWYPTKASKRVKQLAEAVAVYKQLQRTLQLSYEMVSRQMTLYQGTPGEDFARTAADARPKPTIARQPVEEQDEDAGKKRRFGD